MEIISPFVQVLVRHGFWAALGTAVFLALVMLLLMYGRAKINVMQADQAAAQAARIEEGRIRERDLASREAERLALIRELGESRKQHEIILTNHLAHDREERETQVTLLKEQAAKDEAIVSALREIAEDLKLHREEESNRSGKMLDKMEALRLEVARGKQA